MHATGHFGTHKPQSSQVYGLMAKMPRKLSVFASAPVGQAYSQPPHPIQASATTRKLTNIPFSTSTLWLQQAPQLLNGSISKWVP